MPSNRRKNRGVPGLRRINGVSHSKITFIFTFDTQMRIIEVSSSEPVSFIYNIIMREFGIPPPRQLLFGWPNDVEPADPQMKLQELHLPSTVEIYVATCDEPKKKESPVVGPSRPLMQTSNPDVTIRLAVFDAVNDGSYELPFKGRQTVKDVKLSVGELTGIQLEVQMWSGWPENVMDEQMLMNLKLEKPLHSLVIMRLPRANSDPLAINVGSELTKESEEAPEVMKVAPPPIHVARKSTSKGALDQDRLNKRRLDEFHVVPNPEMATSGARSVRIMAKKKIPLPQAVSGSDGGEGVHQPDANASAVHTNGENFHEEKAENGKEAMDIEVKPSTSKRARTEFGQVSLVLSAEELDPTLLELPKKVSNQILLYLTPLEQLSLRRTCKGTNGWVTRNQEEISLEEEMKWKSRTLLITGFGLKTFGCAIKMGLPITKFILFANEEAFYEDGQLPEFLTNVGLRVKDLTLATCFMFQNPKEHEMLEAFNNLEQLTINNLKSSSEFSAPNPCPSTFRNLKGLKLNFAILPPRDNQLFRPRTWDLAWSMLHDCQTLVYFRFPEIEESDEIYSAGVFGPLAEYLEVRQSLGKSSLEVIDFKNFSDADTDYAIGFLDLLRNCYSKGIKLRNINAVIVQQLLEMDGIGEEELKFCENIVSLVNYRPFAQIAPLVNLEKIHLDLRESALDFDGYPKCYKTVFCWKLSTIKVRDGEDREWSKNVEAGWKVIQEDLHALNLKGERASVEYIEIKCPTYPYFLSGSRVAQTFQNLTKLKISSWFWNDDPIILNHRLVPLWRDLRLEELSIENCHKLNDNSFMGEMNPPVFLNQAISLKILTLDLEETGITDDVFIRVFSRMKFRTFKLLCEDPVNISEKAILSLLNGEFGKHIERFPFDCWTSSIITPNCFAELEKKFRSMI